MKKFIIPIIIFLGGIACFVSYGIIGSEVDSNGVLIEPFWLLPIGYFFLMISILWGVVLCMRYVVVFICSKIADRQ